MRNLQPKFVVRTSALLPDLSGSRRSMTPPGRFGSVTSETPLVARVRNAGRGRHHSTLTRLALCYSGRAGVRHILGLSRRNSRQGEPDDCDEGHQCRNTKPLSVHDENSPAVVENVWRDTPRGLISLTRYNEISGEFAFQFVQGAERNLADTMLTIK